MAEIIKLENHRTIRERAAVMYRLEEAQAGWLRASDEEWTRRQTKIEAAPCFGSIYLHLLKGE